MISDIVYKWIRKRLSDRLYAKLACSIGRASHWERPDTHEGIFSVYMKNGIKPNGCMVLEVGAGSQFYTAFHFLKAGATEVLIAEPKLSDIDKTIAIQADIFKQQSSGLSKHMIDPGRIRCFHDLAEIPSNWNGRIDIVCSNVVLEHFYDLPSFFLHTQRLLRSDGISFNVVDLSDHTYHLFNKFRVTRWISNARALYHLRYSDNFFSKLNDPRTYMNRMLLHVYRELARQYGFILTVLDAIHAQSPRIHPDVLKRPGNALPDELDIKLVSFSLRKR